MPKRNIAKEILEGLHQILAHLRGEGPPLKTYVIKDGKAVVKRPRRKSKPRKRKRPL